MTENNPYPANFVGPVGPIHHADTIERLREELADVRADAALLRAEIERLRHENMRLQTANEYAYGELAKLRAALEQKP